MAKKKLLAIRVSNETDLLLRSLRDRSGSDTLTETVRHALALYGAVLDARDDGQRLFLKDEDGGTKEVLLLPTL